MKTPPKSEIIALLDEDVLNGVIDAEEYQRSLPDYIYFVYANNEWSEYTTFFVEDPMRYVVETAEALGVEPVTLDAQVWAQQPHTQDEPVLVLNTGECNTQAACTMSSYLQQM